MSAGGGGTTRASSAKQQKPFRSTHFFALEPWVKPKMADRPHITYLCSTCLSLTVFAVLKEHAILHAKRGEEVSTRPRNPSGSDDGRWVTVKRRDNGELYADWGIS